MAEYAEITRKEIRPGAAAGSYKRAGFERFDQKDNMLLRCNWDPDFKEGFSFQDQTNNRTELMKRNAPGYGPLDWAMYMATTANAAATNFEINTMDKGGLSWAPIARNPGGLEIRTGEFPKWDGDAVENTRIVKKIARLLGAADVGICEYDRSFIYSRYFDKARNESLPICFDDEPGIDPVTAPTTLADGTKVIPAAMKYAIMLIFPMDPAGIMTAPVLTHSATTFLSYSQISFAVMGLAEFLRGLDFNAIPSSNELGQNIPLAIDAGLGEPTRNCKLAHPVYGSCCRIAKVLTDLPLIPDKPIEFGVREQCKSCGVCAERCPVGAFSKEPDMSETPAGPFSHRNMLQWPAHHDKCRQHWVKVGTNCGICLAVCPLNKPFRQTPKEYWAK